MLVQPGIDGMGKSLQLDALAHFRSIGREYPGVAGVGADVSEAELDRLEDGGHCGVRMNLRQDGNAWVKLSGVSFSSRSILPVRNSRRPKALPLLASFLAMTWTTGAAMRALETTVKERPCRICEVSDKRTHLYDRAGQVTYCSKTR